MTGPEAGARLADAFVDELARCGMTHACIAPGSRSTPLALALMKHPKIAIEVLIDERSAGFVALGMAKASRLPVAVVCTSGTAAANLFPAIVEARYGRVPLIALTADRPPELRDTGAGQTIDQIKMYGDNVKWFCETGLPDDSAAANGYWRSTACRAFWSALRGPKGPVHVNMSFREPFLAEGEASALEGRAWGEPWLKQVLGHESGLADEAMARIDGHTRGVVTVGTGDFDGALAAELANRLGWPLIAEAASGARLPGAISTYDAILRSGWHPDGGGPTLAIRIGSLGTSKALKELLKDCDQVVIDDGDELLDPERLAGLRLLAHPDDMLPSLNDAISSRPAEPSWKGDWDDAEGLARTAIDDYLDSLDAPSEPRVARDLAAALPDGSSLLVASSMPIRDLDWFMAPRTGIDMYANRGANGIDGTTSTAAGIAAVKRDVHVLMGDLAFLHDVGGLASARAMKVDLTIVVINNDGGGIFSFLPQAQMKEGFEKFFGTPHGLSIQRIADAYDCIYERLERAAELPDALDRAASQPGVRIIEAPTDRAANVEIHQRIWQAVANKLR